METYLEHVNLTTGSLSIVPNQMSSQKLQKTIAVDILSPVQMRKWPIICHLVQLLSVKSQKTI